MYLIETPESINMQLIREFGEAFNGEPNFRVVFANDQYEKRWTDSTDEGFQLLHKEVRLLPKYQDDDFRDKFILERLIPVVGETDLVEIISYEPCWVFRDKNGNYLPPRFDAAKMIIEALYKESGRRAFKKYHDPTVDPEYRMQELEKMEQILFGNETSTGDSLAYKEAIVVPEMPKSSLKGEN